MTMLVTVPSRDIVEAQAGSKLKNGGLISLIANATPLTVYTMPTGLTARLWALEVFNGNAADTIVSIGTGLAPLVLAIPRLFVGAGLHDIIPLPPFEFSANITAEASVAGAAPANVAVILYVVSIGG